MDRNVYQSELDRVRFTEAGKSALTDALMTGRAESEQRRGRGPWMKRGAIAALAAVLLVGSAAAVGMSQGWLHFFSSEEEILQATVAGADGSTAGYSFYGGADYGELQSILEMADTAFAWAAERGTLVQQAQGTPSDGWSRMWTEEYEEDGQLLWETYYQADGLSSLDALWDTGLDLTWLEAHYTPVSGGGLADFRRAAGEDDAFRAELVGEYQGEDGQLFNLQYTYQKGSEPVDEYQLVEDGYYEYYTTRDGVLAAIQVETSHTGKSMFWVTVYAGEIDFSMTGTQVELEELHAILDSLELSQLSGGCEIRQADHLLWGETKIPLN